MHQSERALVVGEALVDVVETADRTVSHPGGSPLNVAVTLSRLGIRTEAYLSGIGDDADGELLLEHLRAAGVHVWGSPVRGVPTSRARARIGADGAASYRFDISTRLPPTEQIPIPDLLHVGSLGALREPGASRAAEIVRRCRDALISFDPNIRPSLADDRDAMLARVAEIAAHADIVKLSDEDAAWLHPGLSFDAVAKEFLAGGAALVAVTLGGSGCLLWSAAGSLRLSAPRVEVVDTVGAGDTFMGAMLAIVSRRGWRETVQARAVTTEMMVEVGEFAMRCAAVTVSRAGADPPTAADLDF